MGWHELIKSARELRLRSARRVGLDANHRQRLIAVALIDSGAEPLEVHTESKPEHPFVNSVTAFCLDRGYLRVATKRTNRSVGVQHHVRDVRSRIAEVRRIGRIERFCAEFKLDTFPNSELPEHT